MEELKEKDYRERALESIDFFSIAESHIHATALYKKYAHFRVDHTRRVYRIACKLAKGYRNVDYTKIKVMCAIHDMFKYTATTNHGNCAANYLKEFFIDAYFPEGHESRSEWELVLEALSKHSDKNEITETKNMYLAILMDADMLDKIHPQHVQSLHTIFMNNKSISEVLEICINAVDQYQNLSMNFSEVAAEFKLSLRRIIK